LVLALQTGNESQHLRFGPSWFEAGMGTLGHNLILLVLVACGGLVLFFYGCPWLDAVGHKGFCYFFFVVLIVVLLYVRSSGAPKRRAPRPGK
jgi:heme A synthase